MYSTAVPAESHQASHDALTVVGTLEHALNGVTPAEVHLLAYLSCLLSLYGGCAAADWGYDFVRSEWGAPFSAELGSAIDKLRARGYLASKHGALRTTGGGIAFSNFLRERDEHSWRNPYLDGACSSVLALPVGIVRAALREEPSLRHANLHTHPRLLLSRSETDELYDQFRALSQVIGPTVDDLLVPSVVWLSYLGEVRRQSDVNAAAQAGASV